MKYAYATGEVIADLGVVKVAAQITADLICRFDAVLLDPVKLTPTITAFLAGAPDSVSGAELAQEVSSRFGIVLHRRTVERARRR